MPYNDIICGKTGKHFSTYEQLQECRKICHSGICPYEQSEISHSPNGSVLTADDIDRLFNIGDYSKPPSFEDTIKANIDWKSVSITGKRSHPTKVDEYMKQKNKNYEPNTYEKSPDNIIIRILSKIFGG